MEKPIDYLTVLVIFLPYSINSARRMRHQGWVIQCELRPHRNGYSELETQIGTVPAIDYTRYLEAVAEMEHGPGAGDSAHLER